MNVNLLMWFGSANAICCIIVYLLPAGLWNHTSHALSVGWINYFYPSWWSLTSFFMLILTDMFAIFMLTVDLSICHRWITQFWFQLLPLPRYLVACLTHTVADIVILSAISRWQHSSGCNCRLIPLVGLLEKMSHLMVNKNAFDRMESTPFCNLISLWLWDNINQHSLHPFFSPTELCFSKFWHPLSNLDLLSIL